MCDTSFNSQCIAMAGIVQAAYIADEIATTGKYSEKYMKASINSIFYLNTAKVAEIYPDISKLKLGLEHLISIYDGRVNSKSKVVRYTFAIIQLHALIVRDSSVQIEIYKKLRANDDRSATFLDSLPDQCYRAAQIYLDTLSNLRFKIYISGDKQFIKKENNEESIRAILLAGVRAAFLWHQSGGRRWKLFFQRQKMVKVASNLSKIQALV